jgi:hypothetical protein
MPMTVKNVSHGIPENSSVVFEAFGNIVNTIVDTGNCHTGSNSASLPENYFQPNVRSDFSFQCEFQMTTKLNKL